MSEVSLAFCRRNMLSRLASEPMFDLVIIGGGIHGCSLARQASQLGLRVAVLEQEDFAFGISSRSSKMLHGGVRYLEQGHLGLVKEALAERAYYLLQAPHLTRVQKFLLPITKRNVRPAWQMWFGLKVYSTLARIFQPRHARDVAKQFFRNTSIDPTAWKILSAYGFEASHLLSYYDGQMDDTRIVIENAIASSENGACLLNKARVSGIIRKEQSWEVTVDDELCDTSRVVSGRYLVNFAGPWVKQVHECWQPWSAEWSQPVYVRGTHLLFDFSWPMDGMIIATNEPGRYYFIWPHFTAAGSATLVGPTSVLCEENEEHCVPSESEIEELLGYLQQDFPYAEFTRERMLSAFAGMRILAGPPKSQESDPVVASVVSRDDVCIEEEGYLALLGGKYTTARSTARSVLKKCIRYLESQGQECSEALRRLESSELETTRLPGARNIESLNTEELGRELVEAFGLSKTAEGGREAKAAVKRFGTRARLLLEFRPEAESELRTEEQAMQAFVTALSKFCIRYESAVDVSAIARRLGWDEFPGLISRYESVIIEELENSKKYIHSN